MSKELHINTILAQAGIKSDKATGALVTPLHFQQPISIQSLVNLLDLTIRVLKTQLAVRRKKSWRPLSPQTMP